MRFFCSTKKTSAYIASLIFFIFILQGYWQESFIAAANTISKEISPLSEISSQTRPHFYNFVMDDIDGKPIPLERFKGKVLLVVNTASFCGNTPQYEGLQTLYKQYKDQGFEILAFPANDFGRQEPGTNEEIANFCYTKYAIDFPLFSKIAVKGPNKHPLYQYLTEESPFKGEVRWNFQKYLLNRDGQVIAKFRPGLNPLSENVVKNIIQALGQS